MSVHKKYTLRFKTLCDSRFRLAAAIVLSLTVTGGVVRAYLRLSQLAARMSVCKRGFVVVVVVVVVAGTIRTQLKKKCGEHRENRETDREGDQTIEKMK